MTFFTWSGANTTDEGWLTYFSGGYQLETQRFKVGDNSIGANVRLGLAVRNIAGFSKDEFWSDLVGTHDVTEGNVTTKVTNPRKRTFIGWEAAIRFDLGAFRPTLLITGFPKKDNISQFSGVNFNLVFDLNQLFNLERTKSISSENVLTSVIKKRISSNTGKYLNDQEALLWKDSIKLLSQASNPIDIDIFNSMITELQRREIQISSDNSLNKIKPGFNTALIALKTSLKINKNVIKETINGFSLTLTLNKDNKKYLIAFPKISNPGANGANIDILNEIVEDYKKEVTIQLNNQGINPTEEFATSKKEEYLRKITEVNNQTKIIFIDSAKIDKYIKSNYDQKISEFVSQSNSYNLNTDTDITKRYNILNYFFMLKNGTSGSYRITEDKLNNLIQQNRSDDNPKKTKGLENRG